MYSIETTNQFEKSLKECKRKGKRIAGLWECHIEDDWLLIWKQNNKQLTLLLTDTGSHDYLFGRKGGENE